ncbi:MAG TPA: DNA/RNA nuclease SfsA, partial [Gammaproteobacteria bacterium]|nr:DNA/RNA nuclease SfsA [Gammaproteobacteria bacterium]
MKFASPLKEGILLKRHKPFLAEIAVKKDDQKIIFCPNQGILHGCDVLGSRVWFSESSISNSRYPLTWELVEVNGGHLVCVNATVAPALVLEGMQNQVIPELMHLTFVR